MICNDKHAAPPQIHLRIQHHAPQVLSSLLASSLVWSRTNGDRQAYRRPDFYRL